MYKVIFWGVGGGYENLINQIQFEIMKKTISVCALIARPKDVIGDTLDGFKLIKKENIWEYDFDYLIITSSRWYKEIRDEALSLNIAERKIINGSVFKIPFFDFSRYIRLIENPVTILSDDCWGGYLYHELCMKFNSPLINVLFDNDSFIKFIQEPMYYLGQSLVMVREGNIRSNMHPIASLGEDSKKIHINFLHSICFSNAETEWNRRRERINYNNIFIKMGFEATEEKRESYLRIFEKIPYNKICFYSGKTDLHSVVYLKQFEKWCQQGKRVPTFRYTEFIRNMNELFKCIDVLKLLNGEEGYLRHL